MVAVNSCPEKIVDGLILPSAGRKLRTGAYVRPPASVAPKTLLGITLFQRSPSIEYRRQGMLGQDDPLFNFHYTAKFHSTLYGVSVWSIVRMMGRNEISSPNLRFSSSMDVPLLVGVGDQNELFSVESAKSFFGSFGRKRKEFLVIPERGTRLSRWFVGTSHSLAGC